MGETTPFQPGPEQRNGLHWSVAALMLLLLILQGCAAVPPVETVKTVEQRFDRAMAAEDYRSALALLDRLDAEDFAHLLDRRTEIEAAADQASAVALATGEQLVRAGYLGLAVAILEGARSRLPANALLEDRIETLSAARATEMDALEAEHLRLEAEHLLRQRQVIEKMSRLTRDPGELPWPPEEIEEKAARLAERLDTRASREDDPAARLPLLRRAEALAPSEQRQQALALLQPPPAATNDAPGDLRRTTAELRRALQWDDLPGAQRICRDPAWSSTGDRTLDALCSGFEQRRAAWLEEVLEDGRRLYATGQIEAAIEQWRRGQHLAPEHTGLSTALERAERVQERLESLRERVDTEPDPETVRETIPGSTPEAPPDPD